MSLLALLRGDPVIAYRFEAYDKDMMLMNQGVYSSRTEAGALKQGEDDMAYEEWYHSVTFQLTNLLTKETVQYEAHPEKE